MKLYYKLYDNDNKKLTDWEITNDEVHMLE